MSGCIAVFLVISPRSNDGPSPFSRSQRLRLAPSPRSEDRNTVLLNETNYSSSIGSNESGGGETRS